MYIRGSAPTALTSSSPRQTAQSAQRTPHTENDPPHKKTASETHSQTPAPEPASPRTAAAQRSARAPSAAVITSSQSTPHMLSPETKPTTTAAPGPHSSADK